MKTSSEAFAIEAAGISKRYNRHWIIKDLSFRFENGVYAITGPNGSGKSTLMQMLWGQLPPSSGKVTFYAGDQTMPLDSAHRFINVAAPYMDLIEEFTLREHLHFHYHIKCPVNDLSIEQIIDRLNLQGEADKRIADFSSGMKQRLKIGLALLSQANAIFLDEPTTNLDAATRQWYQSLLPEVSKTSILIIASNNEDEYPANAIRLNVPDYKKA